MGCAEGYYSYPKDSAPKRISLQTGIICNLFGVQSPLCKWVDELLPSLPIADALKDVGKQLAKKIRTKIKGKIDWKTIENGSSSPNFIKTVLDWKKQIDEINEIIDTIIDTINGGEVSTLEFCLAGKPEFPEPINYGDVFLAFSGVYPSFLVDKLSRIIAYEKYFELCECRQFDSFPELEIIENELVPIPEYSDVIGTNECNPLFSQYVQNNLNNFNRKAKLIKTKDSWEAYVASILWKNTFLYRDYGYDYTGFTFEYCLTDGVPFQIIDIPLFDESIILPATGILSGCCKITLKRFKRQVQHPSFDVRYEWVDSTGQGEPFCYFGGAFCDPCDVGNLGVWEEFFAVVVRGENVCYKSPEYDPPNLDIEPIEPPLNPCDNPQSENYQGLCPECPPPDAGGGQGDPPNCPPSSSGCQEISANVPVVRDCQIFIEPRSLYWN